MLCVCVSCMCVCARVPPDPEMVGSAVRGGGADESFQRGPLICMRSSAQQHQPLVNPEEGTTADFSPVIFF